MFLVYESTRNVEVIMVTDVEVIFVQLPRR